MSLQRDQPTKHPEMSCDDFLVSSKLRSTIIFLNKSQLVYKHDDVSSTELCLYAGFFSYRKKFTLTLNLAQHILFLINRSYSVITYPLYIKTFYTFDFTKHEEELIQNRA